MNSYSYCDCHSVAGTGVLRNTYLASSNEIGKNSECTNCTLPHLQVPCTLAGPKCYRECAGCSLVEIESKESTSFGGRSFFGLAFATWQLDDEG